MRKFSYWRREHTQHRVSRVTGTGMGREKEVSKPKRGSVAVRATTSSSIFVAALGASLFLPRTPRVPTSHCHSLR